MYLNPDPEQELVRAARRLNSIKTETVNPDRTFYAEIIEKLNQENRSLQLQLELAQAESESQVRTGTTGNPAEAAQPGEDRRTTVRQSPAPAVPPPAVDTDISNPAPAEIPPDQGEQLLSEIASQFEEWSLPEQVLGETRTTAAEFRDFTGYAAFREWFDQQSQLLLITDPEGELLGFSGAYRQAVGDAVADGLTGTQLATLFDETAVMLFLYSPADRSFPLVVDRALLREVKVTRQTLMIKEEPVGYIFRLARAEAFQSERPD